MVLHQELIHQVLIRMKKFRFSTYQKGDKVRLTGRTLSSGWQGKEAVILRQEQDEPQEAYTVDCQGSSLYVFLNEITLVRPSENN